MDISERILALLKRCNMKKKDFAEAMGIVPQNVGKLIDNPSYDRLCKIAEVFGLSVSELVSDEVIKLENKKENEMRCPHCGKPIKVGLSKA